MKINHIMFLSLCIWTAFLSYFFIGCGDVASTHSSTVNTQDNSIDNSQHGVVSCSQGSTKQCSPEGSQVAVSFVCKGPSDELQIVQGPDFSNFAPDDCGANFDTEGNATSSDADVG